MKALFVLARMTFLESVRDRLFLIFFVSGAIMFGVSVALGNLSFAEQERMAANFGLSFTHFISICVAIALGVGSYHREFDRKTIHLLLSKPLERAHFLFGKWIGFAWVLLTFVTGLGLLLGLVLWTADVRLNANLPVVFCLIYFESLVILSCAIFCVSWSRSLIAGFLSLSFFFIGHWLGSLHHFASKSSSQGFKLLGEALSSVWPNLELFNYRDEFINGVHLGWAGPLGSAIYGLCVCSAFIAFTYIILRRRDLV